MVMTQEATVDQTKEAGKSKKKINFDLKPEELIAYLDQYVVKQDNAKAILATKICTHFNRINAPWNQMIPSAAWSAASRTTS